MADNRNAILILAVLTLFFFWPLVVHPADVLYSDYSDILAEHIPAKRFLVRSWRETGELPLWCPYSFAGSPFVHDIQVGIFYPPHFLLYLLPEAAIGPGVCWLIVLHVFAAGCCMHAYARWQRLTTTGSLIAAIGYMFAGKWLLHVLGGGHYITVGLAWLPLVLLFLERAVREGNFLSATWAGTLFGAMALGTQPQWTFYAGILLALWTLGAALELRSTLGWRAFLRWAGFGAWAVVLTAGIVAIQFLPTLEMSRESMRGAGVDTPGMMRLVLQAGLQSLMFLVGPSLMTDPPFVQWEDRGGFGLLWIALAAMAPFLRSGNVRYRAGVALGLFAFAFGGAVLFQWLPGFRLFRQPARMLMIATFPVAFLTGVTIDALLAEPSPGEKGFSRCRGILRRVVAGVAILTGLFALRLTEFESQPLRFHVYWPALLLTVPAAFWLLRDSPRPRAQTALLWQLVLLADLWALAWPLVEVRAESQIYSPSRCVRYLIDHRDAGRVLDRDPTGKATGSPLGTGAPLALIYEIESLRGYNPLDTLRYKEYLQFVRGEDGPLVPFGDVLAFPVISDFPIRNKRLLDLLGVRYLLQPSDRPLEQAGWKAVEEDPQPWSYDFAVGSVRPLPPYTVYENTQVMPRAFVVPHAKPMPERSKVLAALTETDFRDTVLLEKRSLTPFSETGPFSRNATIRSHQPNRVVIDVEDGPAGYLVLTDIWYPGWTCTVDGTPRTIDRADFLFRAVEVEPGAHTVVFTFAPDSYRYGMEITLATLAILLCVHLVALGRRWFNR